MGEINLIPGQQVKGQGRTSPSVTSPVKYSNPSALKVSLKPSWWERRKAARAARQVAQPAKVVPKIPTPVQVDLLADAQPAPRVPPPPAKPLQAEPDFMADAPPSKEAYYIRRPVKPTPDPKLTKRRKPQHSTGREQHQPSEVSGALLDVNLIPKEFGLATKPKHPWSELVRYVVVSLLLVGVAYGGLRWYEYKLTSDTTVLKAQVATLDQQIAGYTTERDQATVVQQKLTGLTSILGEHINYASFFSFLEEQTLPTVYYKNVNVDARTGSVSASAVTSDFDQLRAQVAVLEDNPLVTSVTVNSATRTVPTTPTEEGVSAGQSTLLFNLTFMVDLSLFHE